MKLFGATWLIATVLWHGLSQSAHCAALRDLGNATLNRADLLLMWAPALLLFALLAAASHRLSGSRGLRFFYAAIGTVLGFVAVMVLSLALPFCAQTLA